MSRFFSKKYAALEPYTPGEQPTIMKYTKLNTNESPFPPCEEAVEFAQKNVRPMNLYPELECEALRKKLAEMYAVDPDEIIMTNGSDEILNFCFMSFCDDEVPAMFPSISYGFYSVFAQLNHVPYTEVPLKEDFSIDPKDYYHAGKTIFIANPNAPTGMLLSVQELEEIVKNNPDNVVIIDEAYIDFGGESAIPLIHKYDNVLICQTYSKSRSLAGARLGYGIACKKLIQDINTIKYSTNPYNINNYTMALGLGVLMNQDYFTKNCKTIIENREYTIEKLEEMGFTVLPSKANFVFAKHETKDGTMLYEKLKENGVLVRHFTKERIKDYLRISIGTKEQMDQLLNTLQKILED